MRKVLSIMVVALMSVVMSASAQFVTTGHKSSVSQPATTNKGWSTLYLEWNPSSLYDGGSSIDLTGFSLGYNHAFGLSSSAPLYLETGIGAQCILKTGDNNFWMTSAKVPINLVYAIQITNSSITLFPYAGLGLRFNIYGEDDSEPIFSDDSDCQRFQIGLQLGLKARFGRRFLLGAGYYNDILKFEGNSYFSAKIRGGAITIGYVL